jgi:pSer/pThr/pTyr-binding forkhead associated (FHA) protein
MIVSIDDVVIREVQLTKDKTTLGRRPYNDVVIDNLAVSGEHAVVQMVGNDVLIEDLNSTNGTYINGKIIKKQQLRSGDTVEIGKYKIVLVADDPASAPDDGSDGSHAPAAVTVPAGLGTMPVDMKAQQAVIKVLSGAASGREMPLSKIVTTIGKPGVAVAAITRRHQGYVVHYIEGSGNPTLNGLPIGKDPMALKSGDVIELAGTQMQFVLP